MKTSCKIIDKTHINKIIEILDNTICQTLGPNGHSVITSKNYVRVTKDGISIASMLGDHDPIIDTLLKIITESSVSVARKVGDGTTTSATVAKIILSKFIEKAPISYSTRKEIEEDINKICNNIKENKEKVNSNIIKHIARISSNNDTETSNIAVKATEYAGKDGLVVIERSNDSKTYWDKEKGYKIPSGMMHPYFATRDDIFAANYKNPYVLVTSKPLDVIQDILKTLEVLNVNNIPVIIVTNSISQTALNQLLLNKKNGLQVCVITIPGTGDTVKEFAMDISTYCGVPYHDEYSNVSHDDFFLEYVEQVIKVKPCNVKEIRITMGATTFTPHSDTDIVKYTDVLRNTIENVESEKLKSEIKHRISMLLGKISIIYVGAHTDIHIQEKRDRIDDIVHAIRSAEKSGYVIGGGLSFLNLEKYPELSNIPAMIKPNMTADEYRKYLIKNHVYDSTDSVVLSLQSGTEAALNILTSSSIIYESEKNNE